MVGSTLKKVWCECTDPEFNGDYFDPECTVCGGEME